MSENILEIKINTNKTQVVRDWREIETVVGDVMKSLGGMPIAKTFAEATTEMKRGAESFAAIEKRSYGEVREASKAATKSQADDAKALYRERQQTVRDIKALQDLEYRQAQEASKAATKSQADDLKNLTKQYQEATKARVAAEKEADALITQAHREAAANWKRDSAAMFAEQEAQQKARASRAGAFFGGVPVGEARRSMAGGIAGELPMAGMLQGMTGSGLLGVGGTIAAAGGYATLQASDFEKQMVMMRNNTSMTDAEFKQLRADAIALGKETGASFADIAVGMRQIMDVGFSGADAIKIVAVATKAAIATGTDVRQTADLLASTMHVFHMTADQAAGAMGTLYVAAQKAKAPFAEFVENSRQAVAVGASMGDSFASISAVLSALTRNGFDVAQGATQIKDAYLHIEQPTKAVRQQLELMSESYNKTHKDHVNLVADFSREGIQTKGLAGIFEELSKVVGKHTDLIGKLIPAQRGALGAIVLTGKGLQDLKDAWAATSDTVGSANALAEANARAMGTEAQKAEVVKRQWEALTITIGNKFLPFAKEVTDTLGSWIDKFNQLDPATQNAIIQTGAWVGGLSLLFGGIGKLVIGLGDLKVALGLVTVAEGETATAGAAAFAAGGPWALAIAAAVIAIGGITIAWKQAKDAEEAAANSAANYNAKVQQLKNSPDAGYRLIGNISAQKKEISDINAALAAARKYGTPISGDQAYAQGPSGAMNQDSANNAAIEVLRSRGYAIDAQHASVAALMTRLEALTRDLAKNKSALSVLDAQSANGGSSAFTNDELNRAADDTRKTFGKLKDECGNFVDFLVKARTGQLFSVGQNEASGINAPLDANGIGPTGTIYHVKTSKKEGHWFSSEVGPNGQMMAVQDFNGRVRTDIPVSDMLRRFPLISAKLSPTGGSVPLTDDDATINAYNQKSAWLAGSKHRGKLAALTQRENEADVLASQGKYAAAIQRAKDQFERDIKAGIPAAEAKRTRDDKIHAIETQAAEHKARADKLAAEKAAKLADTLERLQNDIHAFDDPNSVGHLKWLLAQGRTAYDKTVNDPDATPQIKSAAATLLGLQTKQTYADIAKAKNVQSDRDLMAKYDPHNGVLLDPTLSVDNIEAYFKRRIEAYKKHGDIYAAQIDVIERYLEDIAAKRAQDQAKAQSKFVSDEEKQFRTALDNIKTAHNTPGGDDESQYIFRLRYLQKAIASELKARPDLAEPLAGVQEVVSSAHAEALNKDAKDNAKIDEGAKAFWSAFMAPADKAFGDVIDSMFKGGKHKASAKDLLRAFGVDELNGMMKLGEGALTRGLYSKNSVGSLLKGTLGDLGGKSLFKDIGAIFKTDVRGSMLEGAMAIYGGARALMAAFGAGGKKHYGGLLGGIVGGVIGSLVPGGWVMGAGIGSNIGSMLGFAGGGDPPIGRVSLVGEHGPELIVPRKAATVIPNRITEMIMNGRTGGAGGGHYIDARTEQHIHGDVIMEGDLDTMNQRQARTREAAIRNAIAVPI